MKLRAILIDSWHQARDRRALLVLSILSGLVVLFCAGMSFSARSPLLVLEEQTKALGSFTYRTEHEHNRREVSVAFTASPARSEPGGAMAIEIAFRTAREIDRFVSKWREFRSDIERHVRRRARDESGQSLPTTDPSFSQDARGRALEERLADAGYSEVHATVLDPEGTRFAVTVVPRYPHEVRGAVNVGMLFGLVDLEIPSTSKAEVVVLTETIIANSLCGTIGLLIALLVCAGFVPDLLHKGTLDLALARPIGRSALLLGKYLGGLWFVAIFATATVGGSWLALGLRTGYWSPHFLLTIVTTVVQFAVLYSIATWIGLWSRSGGLSALVAIGIWMIAGAIAGVRQASKGLGFLKMPDWVDRTVETVYTILPKTSDLSSLNTVFLAKAWLSPEARARVALADPPHIDYLFSLGTTALFTAAMLGLACWIFERRDW